MKGKKITKTAIRRSIPLYLLLLPSFVLLFCFSYLPLGGLVMAFERYSPSLGIFHSPFVGFDNFLQFFRSYQFWPTIRNTLVLSFYSLLIAFPLPILLALLCNQLSNGLFKKTFQVITYLPHFISTMVMCGLILIFLSPSSGLFANLFHLFGRDFPNVMASASNMCMSGRTSGRMSDGIRLFTWRRFPRLTPPIMRRQPWTEQPFCKKSASLICRSSCRLP